MGRAEKEGGLPVFDTDILNFFFFLLPTAGITAQILGKIGVLIPAAEGLRMKLIMFHHCMTLVATQPLNPDHCSMSPRMGISECIVWIITYKTADNGQLDILACLLHSAAKLQCFNA